MVLLYCSNKNVYFFEFFLQICIRSTIFRIFNLKIKPLILKAISLEAC